MQSIKSGVILITGEHGTGKTRLALEAGDIRKTILIDDDLKGRSTVDRIKSDLQGSGHTIGRYVDFLGQCEGKKWLEVYHAGMGIIDSITPGQFDVLVWDTWTNFASSLIAYIQANMGKFEPPNGWSPQGKIKNGEMYKAAKLYEAQIISQLQKKVPLVILVSHLKNDYKNGFPTGKMIPAVTAAVDKVTDLRFWVKHNQQYSTPIALVLKNTERNTIGEDGRLRPVKVFPTKITPKPGETSLWDSLFRYYNNPIGDRKPLPEETPDDYESSIVEGTLTEDQRLSWLYAIKAQQEEEKELQAAAEMQMAGRARKLKEEGKPLPVIVNTLKSEFGVEVTVPQVAGFLS